MNPQFEWDEDKAAQNLEKHGVSFEEASDVFDDPFMGLVYDEDHSDAEDRFVAIGVNASRILLIVVHTIRDNRIRLISARVATKAEREAYEEGF